MPHSHHGKDSSAKRKHRRSGSHVSRSRHEKPKQLAEDLVKITPLNPPATSNVQQPAAEQSRPWSPWIPGGDGRWFYQGRLKPDGSGWEYQFTEGYPPAPRRREPDLREIYQAAAQKPPYSQQTAAPTGAAGARSPTAHHPHAESGGDDAEDGGNDKGEQDENGCYTRVPTKTRNHAPADQQPQAAVLEPPPRDPVVPRGGGGGQAAALKHAGGKKLSAIIKADKERRISSRRRIKSWLSEVTP